MAFVKQLEDREAEQKLKEDRGPLDLTRRIEELEAENNTLKERLDTLQKVMFDQFRNKGDL